MPEAKTKLRQQLDTIDRWLCEEGGADLMAVLAATRGPDHGVGETEDARDLSSHEAKSLTTQPIRSAAFPRAAAKRADCALDIAMDFAAPSTPLDPSQAMFDRLSALCSGHFAHHAWAASDVLCKSGNGGTREEIDAQP